MSTYNVIWIYIALLIPFWAMCWMNSIVIFLSWRNTVKWNNKQVSSLSIYRISNTKEKINTTWGKKWWERKRKKFCNMWRIEETLKHWKTLKKALSESKIQRLRKSRSNCYFKHGTFKIMFKWIYFTLS